MAMTAGNSTPTPVVRYRFADFVVSPQRRVLLRDGREVPLIPRYFDLLVLLIERRHEAVHRQLIFDTVWSDVVVSDGALSQAIRTLRRALGDDSREPLFIRTVSRHGYRFVADVAEEPDTVPAPVAASRDGPTGVSAKEPATDAAVDAMGPLVEVLLASARAEGSLEDGRDAAERLHGIDTAEALRRLEGQPGEARARALLRDARWDVPGAGAVPLMGIRGGLGIGVHLVRLRLERAWRAVRSRWASAAAGAGTAGALGGALGGVILALLPGAGAPWTAAVVLALVGASAGAVGAAGVGAGLAAAEAVARSKRATALVVSGALGGLLAGIVAHALVRWTLDGLFGLRLPAIGGPWEGLTLGAAAGLGYAVGAPHPAGGGMVTPHRRERLVAVLLVAACCGGAALLLSASGRPMVGGLVNAIAQASQGSAVALAPLGALLGEPEFGPLSRMLAAAFEGALFGAGLTFGLTRRPRGGFGGGLGVRS